MSKFRPAPKLQSEEAFIKGAEAPRAAASAAAPAPVVKKDVPVAAKPAKKATPAPVATVTALPSQDPESSQDAEHPWEAHDPASKTTATTQPLRLNAHQYEQLKWLAETQDRSLAQILRRLVGPALDEAVRTDR